MHGFVGEPEFAGPTVATKTMFFRGLIGSEVDIQLNELFMVGS